MHPHHLLVPLLLLITTQSQVYDPNQQRNDQYLLKTKCNANCIIHFVFSPTSTLTCPPSTNDCSVVPHLLSSQLQKPTTSPISMQLGHIDNTNWLKHKQSNSPFLKASPTPSSSNLQISPKRTLFMWLCPSQVVPPHLTSYCKRFQ